MVAAVATDVGAWRVVSPVVRELRARGVAVRAMLAEPAATFARREGAPHDALLQSTLGERADAVLELGPAALLLGTSAVDVAERAIVRQVAQRVPSVAIVDAMLTVEQRFGPGLRDLPTVTACPDAETAERLRSAGATPERLAVTGNPALEAIAAVAAAIADERPPDAGDGRVEILFVSQPTVGFGLPEGGFVLDERESLDDLVAALGALQHLAPRGYRVRVRWHPVQRPDQLPATGNGVQVVADTDRDRLRSAARARVVVGINSSMLAEVRMLPRWAIAYLPGPYWQREPVYARHQGVRVARSADRLRAFLAMAIEAPPEPAPIAWHAGAAARVADLVLELTARAPA